MTSGKTFSTQTQQQITLSFLFYSFMATCVIEDTGLPSICYQRTNSMEHASPFRSIHQRCQFDIRVDTLSMDSTARQTHQKCTKRRQFNRSHTYTSENDLTQILADSSCGAQAASVANNDILTARPNTLLLNAPRPSFRTCLSYPTASPLPIDDTDLSPMKFGSLPVLASSSAKRFRPLNLNLTTTTPRSVPELSTADASSLVNYIDAVELARKLQSSGQLMIFDCGSPLRNNENRIGQSTLLRVSDKISRKRLKSNPSKFSPIDAQQLTEFHSIVLYDDHCNSDGNLSAGIKCACEEVQRCLATKPSPIFILKDSFEQFSAHYPHLCEAAQSTACTFAPLAAAESDLATCPMTHILDGLYIGNESNAQSREELSSENIRYILNVTSHVPLHHSECDQFHYFHIPADDTQKQNLLDHFERAYAFILRAIENHEKVLVHCVAGISRSPAIVISFLMRYARMSMNEAYEFVKSKRAIVAPNLNFMGQLLQYEKRLRDQN